ncbi:MAG: hypothetical protein ACE5PV_02010 [Candidatus Poribacteria bacterium]
MKELMRTWILSLDNVFIILGFVLLTFIFSISAMDVEGQNVDPSVNQLVDQLLGDIPDFVKDVLEKEGIDLKDVIDDPELRQEIREKVMDNPEIREEFQKRKAEIRMDEETRQGKSEGERPIQGDNKRQRKGGQKVNEYYKSIVDKNLFRPLGWGGDDKRGPAFRLIGTVINKSKKPKALIFQLSNNTTHYVAVGDKIGNATVKSIDEKSVTLNQDGGKELKLNLVQESPFLGGSVGGRGGGGPQVGGGTSSPRENPAVNKPRIERPDRQKLREKLKKMSREEREKFIQKMREDRRRERGGDGNRGGAIRREMLRRR